MRRAGKDYEDKAMSSKKPPSPEPSGPAPAGEGAPSPAGPPVDVRPSERELAEERERAAAGGATGTPRPSEAELAEQRAVPEPAPPPEDAKP